MVKKKEQGKNWDQKRNTGKTQQPFAHTDSYIASAQNTLKGSMIPAILPESTKFSFGLW